MTKTHQRQFTDRRRISDELLEDDEEADHENDVSGERDVAEELDVSDHHQADEDGDQRHHHQTSFRIPAYVIFSYRLMGAGWHDK